MRTRINRTLAAIAVACAGWAGLPPALAQAPPPEPQLSPEAKEAERKVRLQMAADGLEKLYKLQPEAQGVVERAVGYAVFEVDSIYALLFVGQKGKGVL